MKRKWEKFLFLQKTPQSRAADAQAFGGGALISSGLFQDGADNVVVDLVQRPIQVEGGEGGGAGHGGRHAALLLNGHPKRERWENLR